MSLCRKGSHFQHYLNVELQVAFIHLPGNHTFYDLYWNQLEAIIGWTKDIMCFALLDFHVQKPKPNQKVASLSLKLCHTKYLREKKKVHVLDAHPSQHARQNSWLHGMSTGSSNTEILHMQIPHCQKKKKKHKYL